MNHRPKIKIGLLGGRGMGKTVFLVSLKEIPSYNYSFGSLSIDNEETLRFLKEKHDELEEKGQLPSTTSDEVRRMRHFHFTINSSDMQGWDIILRDYPGELVEAFTAEERYGMIQQAIDQLSFVPKVPEKGKRVDRAEKENTLDKAMTKDLRRLLKWIRQCDVIVILVPADLDELGQNPREIEHYRDMMALHAAGVRKLAETTGKTTPVILAISKWDKKFPKCNVEPEKNWNGEIKKFIDDNQIYCSFYDCLHNSGISDCPIMPFSAFGRHKNDAPNRIEPGSEPFGVLPILIKACRMGMSAKVSNVEQFYALASSFWTPNSFLAWQRYVYLLQHGIPDPKEQQNALEQCRAHRNRFLKNVAVSLSIVILCLILCIVGNRKWEHLSIHNALTNSPTTPQILEKTRTLLDNTIPLEKTQLLKWLLKWDTLDKLHSDVKRNYIDKIDKRLSDDITPFKDDKKLPYEERILLSGKRTKCIEIALPLFPNGFQKESREKELIYEKDIIGDLTLCGPFDRAFEVLVKKPDKGKVAEIERFIKEWDSNKYFERGDNFKEITKMEAEVERKHFEDLQASWAGIKDPVNEHWKKRIELAQKRLSAGQSKLDEFSKDSHYLRLIADREKEEKDLIGERNHYGPFEDELVGLKLLPKSGKVGKIDEFIKNRPKKEYQVKENDYVALDAEKKALEAEFNGTIQNQLDNSKDKDVAPENWEQRIAKANERKKIINDLKPQFSPDSQYLKKYNQLLSNEDSSINDWTYHKKYVDALKELNNKPDNEILAACEKFIMDWAPENHPALNVAGDINNVKDIAGQRIWENLKVQIEMNKDVESLTWQKRVEFANKRIDLIKETRKGYPSGNQWLEKLDSLNDENNNSIIDLTHYGTYDDALRALRNKPDNEILAACDKFLIDYSQIVYPKRDIENDIKGVKDTAGNKIWKGLELTLDSLKDDSGSRWEHRRSLAKDRIQAIKAAGSNFPSTSPWAIKIADELKKEDAQVYDFEHYGSFDDKYNKISTSKNPIIICDFLKEHPLQLYPKRKDKLEIINSKKDELEKILYQDLFNQCYGNSSRFMPADISDSFIKRIKEGTDPLSAYLKSKFSPTAIEVISTDKTSPFTDEDRNSIATALNPILEDVCIYDETRFPDNPDLLQEIKQWKTSNPETAVADRLNRYLLEIAYPELPKFHSKSDDPILHWTERQKITEERIKILADGKSGFSSNSPYIKELDDRIKRESEFIGYLKFYGDFDDKLEEVKKLPSLGKIKKIIDFEEDNSIIKYPDRPTAFKRLEEIKKQLEKQFHSELLQNLGSEYLKDNEKLPWRTRCARASDRIEAIEKLKDEFLPDRYLENYPGMIKTEKENIKQWTLYGAFDDEYNELYDSLPTGKIRRIIAFLKKYDKREYKERLEKFKEIENQIANLKKEFENKLQKDLNSCCDDKSKGWEWRASMAEKRIYYYERAIIELAENDPVITDYNDRIRNENENVATWHRYAEIESLATSIDAFPSINGIYELLEKYPEEKNEELKSLYERMKAKKTELVNSLFTWVDEKLKVLPRLGDDYATEEQEKRIGERIAVIDVALSQAQGIFLKDDIPERKKLIVMRISEEVYLKDKQKYKEFDDELADMKSKWASMNPSSIIISIDNFIRNHLKKDYPYRNAEFDALLITKNDCEIKIKQEEFKNKVLSLVNKYPNGDEDKLNLHINTAKNLFKDSFDNKLGEWSELHDLRKTLSDTIKAAQKELVGYLAIKRINLEYKSNQTKENYDKFMVAVKKYKETSPSASELAQVESLVKEVQYKHYSNDIIKKCNEYYANPSQESCDAVMTSYNEFIGIGVDDKEGIMKAYRDNVSKDWRNKLKLANFSHMLVTLKYLDVSGTPFRDTGWKDDNEIQLKITGDNTIEIGDMDMEKNSKAYSSGHSGDLYTGIKKTITIFLTEIDQTSSPAGSRSISVQGIYQLSGNTGSVTPTLEILEGDSNPAKITLEFSGLPILE